MRVPGRFEDHECTFITWPCLTDLEIKNFEKEIIFFIKKLSKYEKVIIIADPLNFINAKKNCENFSLVWSIPTDWSWIRDNGPIFVFNKNNKIEGIHFQFNGWGKKYFPCNSVKQMPKLLLKKLGIKRRVSNLILEGGGVTFDGKGTMVTTEQMLLNKNRNPNYSKKDIEIEVKKLLGIEKVIWLKKGLFEDKSTDGHVDCVAEYIGPGKILIQTIYNKQNPNYDILKDNLKIIQNETDAMGNKLEIIEMPYLPYFRNKYKNNIYTSPYTNYYIANGVVLVPEVDRRTDHKAYKIIEQVYPQRDILPVSSYYQAIGGGGPGCITQHLPKLNNEKI
ncbi:MAG: agmatine deiminase [Rickettsiales bacterium]|nr:agmatine deiminase [Rickettsiales bacterium]